MLNAQQVNKDTIIVEPYKSMQNYEHFRRLVIESSDPKIEFLQEYDFMWGIRKKILVETTKLKSILSDGTNYMHRYLSTLKMDSTDTFLLSLNGELYYGSNLPESRTLKRIEEGKYKYFDEVNIIVPVPFRSEIRRIRDNKMKSRGLFVYVDPQTIRPVGFKR
jgi:hypothetical protein